MPLYFNQCFTYIALDVYYYCSVEVSLKVWIIFTNFYIFLSTQQWELMLLERHKEQIYFKADPFNFYMHGRQKEWPHYKVVGQIISSRQIIQVNYFAFKNFLNLRTFKLLLLFLDDDCFFQNLVITILLNSFLESTSILGFTIFFLVSALVPQGRGIRLWSIGNLIEV